MDKTRYFLLEDIKNKDFPFSVVLRESDRHIRDVMSPGASLYSGGLSDIVINGRESRLTLGETRGGLPYVYRGPRGCNIITREISEERATDIIELERMLLRAMREIESNFE